MAGVGLAVSSTVALAGSNDAADWLERISRSARELPYSGVFIHQTADTSTLSRITHMVDRQGVEREKLESLDGPLTEVMRSNDEMICYQPDARTVRVDRRASGRFFPALVSGDVKTISENYRLKLGNVERIAGFDCQWLILEPRDAMRYMQKLCAEIGTGLLLRAATFNERNQLLEQFMFTQLDVSRSVGKQPPKSRYEQSQGWQTAIAVDPQSKKDVDTGWKVGNLPAGFRKVMEIVRSLAGRPKPVAHLVFSDGVSHVSVFAEPVQMSGKLTAAGASDDNPTTFAVRSVADHQVTVMGDVPLAAVQSIADGVTRRPR